MLKYFFGAPILPGKQKHAWEKNMKLTLIVSLGYTAHSIWDSSHEQIGRTQTKKKEGAKRHFKYQAEKKRHFKYHAENYEISVYMSV